MSNANDYSCFNCDSIGGGYYKQHPEETVWYIGLDSTGQAHYACEGCEPFLFNTSRADKLDSLETTIREFRERCESASQVKP